MDNYPQRFFKSLEENYVTTYQEASKIREKDIDISKRKNEEYDHIEELKKEQIDLRERIRNGRPSKDFIDLFYTLILGILIIAYPLRIFIFGIYWSLKNIRN